MPNPTATARQPATVTPDTLVLIHDAGKDGHEADRHARLSECFPDPAECDFAAQELARLGKIRVGGGAAPFYIITVAP